MIDKLFQLRLKRKKAKYERRKAKQELKAKYAEYYPQREGAKVSNVMLVVIVVNITIYTALSFWLAYMSGISIDSTLTTAFFAFWGSEIALLAGIKCSKVLKSSKSKMDDDDSVG